MSKLFLGVDAGNSKTLAVTGDERGNILGWGRSGLGDIYGAPSPEQAVDEVSLAISAATSMVGSRSELHAAAFRLAGVDWPEDEWYWAAALAEKFGRLTSCSVKNDGFALLRCGDTRGVGVALSVGTGAAMAGRGIDGEEFVVSWWFQHYLGGAGLGHDALRAVMLAELGMADPTSLTGLLCVYYRAASAEELLHQFTRREESLGHRDKARAARIVFVAASDGDAVALGIVRDHAAQLARYAAVTSGRVGFEAGRDPVPVVLGGSVLSAPGSILRSLLVESLGVSMTNARVIDSRNASPALGALLDAMAEGGIEITREIQERVLEQRPPHGLLDT